MTGRLIDPPDAKGRYCFVYVPSASTDVKATFDRERKRLAAEKKAQDGVENVTPIKRKQK